MTKLLSSGIFDCNVTHLSENNTSDTKGACLFCSSNIVLATCDKMIYIQYVFTWYTILAHLLKGDWLAIYTYLQLCTL